MWVLHSSNIDLTSYLLHWTGFLHYHLSGCSFMTTKYIQFFLINMSWQSYLIVGCHFFNTWEHIIANNHTNYTFSWTLLLWQVSSNPTAKYYYKMLFSKNMTTWHTLTVNHIKCALVSALVVSFLAMISYENTTSY